MYMPKRKITKIHDEVKAATSLGIEASFVEDIPFQLQLRGTRFDNQSQFHPLKYLTSLAR